MILKSWLRGFPELVVEEHEGVGESDFAVTVEVGGKEDFLLHPIHYPEGIIFEIDHTVIVKVGDIADDLSRHTCFRRIAVGAHVDAAAVRSEFRRIITIQTVRIARVDTRTRHAITHPRVIIRIPSPGLGL